MSLTNVSSHHPVSVTLSIMRFIRGQIRLVLLQEKRLVVLDTQSYDSLIRCDEYWLCRIPNEKCGASSLWTHTCRKPSTWSL